MSKREPESTPSLVVTRPEFIQDEEKMRGLKDSRDKTDIRENQEVTHINLTPVSSAERDTESKLKRKQESQGL